MTYSNWDESEHPRDDIGRFTYKNGGSTPSHEKHVSEMQKIADILYPTMKNSNWYDNAEKELAQAKTSTEYREKLIEFLGNSITKSEEKNAKIYELENILLDNAISAIRNMRIKVKNLKDDFIKNTTQVEKRIFDKVVKEALSWDNAAGDLARNYQDMRDANTKEADRYFHAKGHCQAAQRGLGGKIVSHVVGALREIEEGARKIGSGETDAKVQINDAYQDMKANSYGRELGRKNKSLNCRGLLYDKRPNGLDDKY